VSKHYTKAQAKRALMAINAKRNKLWESGFLTMKDLAEMSKITERAFNRLK